MKRKTTTLLIEADISTLAFNKYSLMEDLNKLGDKIRFFGSSIFDHYSVNYVTTFKKDTALENRKIVKFMYELNISDSNYENNILINMCLNLQKEFNYLNTLLNEANQCYITHTYNSRLDK